MNSSPRRFLALPLVLALAGVGLVGCTVAVADQPAASGTASAPSSTSTGSTPDSAASTAATPAAANPTGTVDDERMARLQRSSWTDAVTQHVVCIDGEYTVDNNADALVVEITGDCREVTIAAHGATVLLPAVDEMKITGDGSIVIVASAREIAIDADADANLVGWEQGTPEVHDAGTLNATTPIS
ncbi:MAG: hypothetical protein LBE44_08185 [Microbacterium hominis]|jgi:hypothetical protein|uniref:hypothetical protein n=1 Tax=Microbacterium TaxID=33882 RepID=UPI0019C783D8|nr:MULTISPECIES: hypothetical protein [Microbacterium]MBD3758871.1 hypothetical protein [Microbacterium sp.]MBZ6371863.1 hypothetical protein [Microbacterium hominis]